MKKSNLFYLLASIILTLSLQACKHDAPPPPSLGSLLTKDTWTISNLDLQNADSSWVSLPEVPLNLAGETINFSTNGTCNEDPIVDTFGSYKWSLGNNQLIVASSIYQVTTLNANVLQLVIHGFVTLTTTTGSQTYIAARLTYNHQY